MIEETQNKRVAQRTIDQGMVAIVDIPNNHLWPYLWQWPTFELVGQLEVVDSVGGQGRNRTVDTRIFSP